MLAAIPDEIDGFTRYSSCIRKSGRYATEDEAKQHIHNLRRAGETKPLHPYFCPFCFHWHVGGCDQDQVSNIRFFEGLPYVRDSTQRSWEDAKRHCNMLTRKGYLVRTRRITGKTHRRYQIYKYRKEIIV